MESAPDIRIQEVPISSVIVSENTITFRDILYRDTNKVIGFSVGIGASARDYDVVTHVSAFIWDDSKWLVSFGSRESNGSTFDGVYNGYDDSYHFNPTDLVHSSGTDVIIYPTSITDLEGHSIPSDVNQAGIIFIYL